MSHIIGRVVVGVDGSSGSLQALRYAVNHARAFDGLLVPVLAWTPPGGEFADRRYMIPALVAEWRGAAERKLQTAFEEGLGTLPEDLQIAPMVVRGPAAAVLTTVANRASDLLVIGAGRRGAVRHALFASTTRKCLAQAQCSVIAVPPIPLALELERNWTSRWSRHVRPDHAGAVAQIGAAVSTSPARETVR